MFSTFIDNGCHCFQFVNFLMLIDAIDFIFYLCLNVLTSDLMSCFFDFLRSLLHDVSHVLFNWILDSAGQAVMRPGRGV